MVASGIEAELLDLLSVFIIAAAVGVFVAKVGRVPYTIALLIAGFTASIGGIELGIELSHDVILLVLLPPLLFEGAATTDLEHFRANLPLILALAIPGLLLSIVVLGFVGTVAFGYPLLLALLFAAMILPTDPVSVLALFKELGTSKRLAVLIEGESLLNDGVGVVVFSALLALLVEANQAGVDAATLLTPDAFVDLAVGITASSLGGLAVGLVAGYAVYSVMVNLDEHMTEIVLTLILAYGSFLLAEHYLGVSGVIATVVAGLFIGNRGAEYAMSPQTKISVFNTWETAAFIVNTVIFLLIGAKTPIEQLLTYANEIAVAVVLVLVARAIAVYPVTSLVNTRLDTPVSRSYQHVMVWGGMHASIPIALALGLPPSIAQREELRAIVFGVAAFSLVVQGLTMRRLVDRLDITRRSEPQRLYELFVGRARAVDAALDAADSLHKTGELPSSVFEDFEEEYGREKDELNHVIGQLLAVHPEIKREERLVGERRVLLQEKSAIMAAMRTGTIGDDVGERILDEIDLKLDRVLAGASTVESETEEGYDEFWRARAREFGLDVPERNHR